jgi:hypothetical protein
MNVVVHRVSPQQARYTPAGGREKCSFCRFFIAPKWCGHVTGPVSPMGWCKYFSQEMRQQFGGSQVMRPNPIVPAIPSTANNWVVSGPAALGGTFLAPDGSTTAPLLSATDTTNTIRSLAYNPTVVASANAAYTFSIFLKKAPVSNAYLQINTSSISAAATAYFDLTNGTAVVGADLIGGFTARSAAIESWSNGWFRCSYTLTTPAATTGLVFFVGLCTTVSASGDNRSAVGVIGQGIYVWGAAL